MDERKMNEQMKYKITRSLKAAVIVAKKRTTKTVG